VSGDRAAAIGVFVAASAILAWVAAFRRRADRDAWMLVGMGRDAVKDVMAGRTVRLRRFVVRRHEGQLDVRATWLPAMLHVRTGETTLASAWFGLWTRGLTGSAAWAITAASCVWLAALSPGLLRVALAPGRRVRHSVTVLDALPDPGGLREAARRPKLVVDGQTAALGETPRIVITETPRGFSVNMLLAEPVRIDTLDREASTVLATLLRTALGLPPS
jgi:hypothetical protein